VFTVSEASLLSVFWPQPWPSYLGPFLHPAGAACSWLPRPWRALRDSDAKAPPRAAPPHTGPAYLGKGARFSRKHMTRQHAVKISGSGKKNGNDTDWRAFKAPVWYLWGCICQKFRIKFTYMWNPGEKRSCILVIFEPFTFIDIKIPPVFWLWRGP